MTDLHEPNERQKLEKDVNLMIKQLLSIIENAARTPPIIAVEPYAAEERRKKVIRLAWSMYKRILQHAEESVA